MLADRVRSAYLWHIFLCLPKLNTIISKAMGMLSIFGLTEIERNTKCLVLQKICLPAYSLASFHTPPASEDSSKSLPGPPDRSTSPPSP